MLIQSLSLLRKQRKARGMERVPDYTGPRVRLQFRDRGHRVPDRIFIQRDKASLAKLDRF